MTKHKLQKETQQARVLGGFTLDGVQYDPNDVIEAHPSIIQSMGNSVDTDPEAIEHCMRLDNPVIKKHEWIPPTPVSTEEQTETTNS